MCIYEGRAISRVMVNTEINMKIKGGWGVCGGVVCFDHHWQLSKHIFDDFVL